MAAVSPTPLPDGSDASAVLGGFNNIPAFGCLLIFFKNLYHLLAKKKHCS
jgi:hypothetical protein